MIKLDYQSRAPIYQQIKSKVLEEILLGFLQPDDQLPTVRTLARELGINPNTIQKAYQELEGEGIIYSLTGKGSFVASAAVTGPKIRTERLEALEAALLEAKLAGVTQQQIVDLASDIFSKGGNAK